VEFLRDTALPAVRPPPRRPHAARLGAGLLDRRRSLFAGHRVPGSPRTPKPGHFSLQIYATDLDVDAVDKARKACYPANIAADLTPERLARHFVAEEGGYRVNREIREMVIFAPQNLISDPPFTRLDILCCRNLLIYFGQALQKKVLPLFHYALNRDGILVLGSAETTGGFSDLFAPWTRRPTSSSASTTTRARPG
jgi:chemotaxis methyl-accepting protein methylase